MFEDDQDPRKQELGSWLSDYEPRQEPAGETEAGEKPSRHGRKAAVIVAIAVIALLLAGCGIAYAVLVQPQAQPEPDAQAEGSVEPTDLQSEVSVLVSTEDPSFTGTVRIAVSSVAAGADGEDEATELQEREVALNAAQSIGKLDPGSYEVSVIALPADPGGVEYQLPRNATGFDVSGDGESVSVFVYLPQATEQDAASDADAQEAQPADDGSESTESAPAAAETAPSSSAVSEGPSAHTHNWVAQTTTVHHDAQYRTVHHDEVKKRVMYCDVCGADVTGNYQAHKAATGHSGYHYENVTVTPAYDEQVLVSGAYDETVVTGYRCSVCGATR